MKNLTSILSASAFVLAAGLIAAPASFADNKSFNVDFTYSKEELTTAAGRDAVLTRLHTVVSSQCVSNKAPTATYRTQPCIQNAMKAAVERMKSPVMEQALANRLGISH